MTDEQLRAMARRMLELVVCPTMCNGGKMRFYPRPEMNGVLCVSAIDAAVAILREEMYRAELADIAKTLPSFERLMAIAEPAEGSDWARSEPGWNNDDPTQTIVIDT